MIPKIIHYIWLGNSPIYDKYIKENNKYLKDYEVRIWTDKDFTFSESDWLRESYLLKRYEFCSDILRWYILNKYGGFYFDTDIKIHRPINEDLLNLNNYLLAEKGVDFRINTGVIGTSANSKICDAFISYYNSINLIDRKSYTVKWDTDRSEDVLSKLDTVWGVSNIKDALEIENKGLIPIFHKLGGEVYNSLMDFSFLSHEHDLNYNKVPYGKTIFL